MTLNQSYVLVITSNLDNPTSLDELRDKSNLLPEGW